ncbi:MAG: hypothetical protein R3A13_00100 [Bdellovibrionota bacterium]
MRFSRLIAVDPSLTCSGWALFCLKTKTLLGVGRIKSIPSKHAFNTRLDDLQAKISKVLAAPELGENDVLIAEAPTFMKDPDAALKLNKLDLCLKLLHARWG